MRESLDQLKEVDMEIHDRLMDQEYLNMEHTTFKFFKDSLFFLNLLYYAPPQVILRTTNYLVLCYTRIETVELTEC